MKKELIILSVCIVLALIATIVNPLGLIPVHRCFEHLCMIGVAYPN